VHLIPLTAKPMVECDAIVCRLCWSSCNNQHLSSRFCKAIAERTLTLGRARTFATLAGNSFVRRSCQLRLLPR
jgi:hypothetical protein